MTRKKDAPAIVEAQPQQGGSYSRDPITGELTRVEGPEADQAPVDEQQAEQPQGDAGEGQQEA